MSGSRAEGLKKNLRFQETKCQFSHSREGLRVVATILNRFSAMQQPVTPSTTDAISNEGSVVAVVLGARGGAGKEVVKALLGQPSVREVRAVVRDPSKVAAGTFPEDPRCKILAGNLQTSTELELKALIDGSTHVFNTAAGRSYETCVAVDCNAVGRTAECAKAAGCQRYLLCSSQLVDPINKNVMIRLILNNVITGKFFKKQKGAMDLKADGEKLLRRSGMEYTIVRPGRLTFGPALSGNPKVGQTNSHFLKGAPTSRADLAAVCVLAALSPQCAGTTFELACEKAKGAAVEAPTERIFDGLDTEWDSKMI